MGIYHKNGSWFIDYYANGRRKREKIGSSRKLAETVLAKRKIEIAENRFLDIKKRPRVLFGEMAEDYIELYSRVNKKSWESDVGYVKNLNRHFGGKYLSEITPRMIEDYKAKRLEDGVTPCTVNHELACMKCLFSKAIEWDKATENPVKKVKLFKENNQRVRFLEKEELKLLLDACREPVRSIVVFAVNTGMRLSEITNLEWSDIDLARKLIVVKNTKNGEMRYIPIGDILMNLLSNLYDAKRRGNSSPYVFGNLKGERYRRFTISHWFSQALKKAGIKDFRFHDLRHTFASHLVMAGADIMTVRELLGHKTLTMTLRYSHLSPNFKRQAIALLDKRMDTFWTPATETAPQIEDKKDAVLSSENSIKNGPIAQLVEHLTFNQGVAGSNPARLKIIFNIS